MSAEKITYVSLSRIVKKYNLSHEKDFTTGREIFFGNGHSLIASVGMSSILVNEKLTVLKDRVESINGEISISERDAQTVKLFFDGGVSCDVDKAVKHSLRKIVIDPGHGGPFRGCKGVNGLIEKNITLDVSKRLKALLEKDNIKIIMTRDRDTSLSSNLNEDLQRRADVANREQADLFISIHCNWSNDPSIEGFEIYYCEDKSSGWPSVTSNKSGSAEPLSKENRVVLSYLLKDEYKSQTVEIAREVKKSFGDLPTDDRGIRKANFRVIKQAKCPSILVEIDFISNKKMARHLADEEYRQRIAEKLKCAIISYGEKTREK
jgi:N-acetylmuramoyl-L-alanine amidase